ncbi:MAG: hypothetical protein AAB373_04160 [Patescibacteria group bacterium]
MQLDSTPQPNTESAALNGATEANPKTPEQARAKKIVAALYSSNGFIKKGAFRLSIEPMSDRIILAGPDFDAAFSAVDLSFLDGTRLNPHVAGEVRRFIDAEVISVLGSTQDEHTDADDFTISYDHEQISDAEKAEWLRLIDQIVS